MSSKRVFQRTDSLVSRIFQRFDLYYGTLLLELLCGSRKLTEPIKSYWTLIECDYVILLTQHKTLYISSEKYFMLGNIENFKI